MRTVRSLLYRGGSLFRGCGGLCQGDPLWTEWPTFSSVPISKQVLKKFVKTTNILPECLSDRIDIDDDNDSQAEAVGRKLTNRRSQRTFATRMHSSRMLVTVQRGLCPRVSLTETPRLTPLDRDHPWTETPDRDPPVMWPVVHAGTETPTLWTEWHRGVKTLPCRNFVASGNNEVDQYVLIKKLTKHYHYNVFF